MGPVCWRTHVKAIRHPVARREHDTTVQNGCAGGVRLRRRTLAISIAVAMTAATAAVAAPVGMQAAPVQSSRSGAERVAGASDYRIPAGSLKRALTTFAAQAGVHVDYSTGLVAGKTSPG